MAMLARGDVDLYYECHGDGAPLLLIAGLASDSLSWQPIVADLAAHYRVITVDNRGAGRTAPPTAPTSIRAMADDCVALIEHLGVPSAHVLGHSMGGFVAQDCAIRYPDKVNALVLAATTSVNSRRNNDMFSDWASALANGRIRARGSAIYSIGYFRRASSMMPPLSTPQFNMRSRIRIPKARRHSRIRSVRSPRSIRPKRWRTSGPKRLSLAAAEICCLHWTNAESSRARCPMPNLSRSKTPGIRSTWKIRRRLSNM
jgi:pimeloyl-ACP methyl ester carboxylesterase